ncbi:MAG: MbnP family copper-binding protein [Myxococcota bacterium]
MKALAHRIAVLTGCGLAGYGLVACGDDSSSDDYSDAAIPDAMDSSTAEVSVQFQALVGGEPFACGSSYDGIGTSSSTVQPNDFRLYIHDVRLLDSEGNEVPLTLTQDDAFQYQDLVLLDFEDGTATCSGGNSAVNPQAVGTVPAGEYSGIRFVLGVPFELNHANAATAPSPLNVTSLFWNWQGGYKFARFDGPAGDLPEWRFHLGSTGCDGDTTGTVPTTTCTNGNRAEVELTNFDPTSTPISADLGALLEGVDLTEDTNGPPGCMSGPKDLECENYFSNLGLSFNGSTPGPQSFFSVSN